MIKYLKSKIKKYARENLQIGRGPAWAFLINLKMVSHQGELIFGDKFPDTEEAKGLKEMIDTMHPDVFNNVFPNVSNIIKNFTDNDIENGYILWEDEHGDFYFFSQILETNSRQNIYDSIMNYISNSNDYKIIDLCQEANDKNYLFFIKIKPKSKDAGTMFSLKFTIHK